MKRVAACDTANGEPGTAERAMALQRRDGIRRTTRIITARRGQERRDPHLIQSDKGDQNGFHALMLDSCSTRAHRPADARQLLSQLVELRGVSRGERAYDEIEGGERRQQLRAHELSKASLEPIPINRGVLVLRHDQPDPWVRPPRRDGSNIEIGESPRHANAIAPQCVELTGPRQAVGARERIHRDAPLDRECSCA